jgi:hypothetical protein
MLRVCARRDAVASPVDVLNGNGSTLDPYRGPAHGRRVFGLHSLQFACGAGLTGNQPYATAPAAILEKYCCGCGAAPGALALPAGLSHPVGPLQLDWATVGIWTHKFFIQGPSRLHRDLPHANDPRLGRCGMSFDASGIFFSRRGERRWHRGRKHRQVSAAQGEGVLPRE